SRRGSITQPLPGACSSGWFRNSTNRPSGASTRAVSDTAGSNGSRCSNTRHDTTASNDSARSGIASAPARAYTGPPPRTRAVATCAAVGSIPTTSAPRAATRRATCPSPHPRSRTRAVPPRGSPTSGTSASSHPGPPRPPSWRAVPTGRCSDWEWPIAHMGYHMRMAKDRPDGHTLSALGSGRLIREARRLGGLTQAELARRLGTTQSAVSNWERGVDIPRVDTLARILEACGFEADLTFRRLDDVDRAQLRQNLALTPAARLESVRNVS